MEQAEDLQIVREPDRFRKTQISRTQWWRLEREGQAPKRIVLSKNSVGWYRHELDRWLSERAARR